MRIISNWRRAPRMASMWVAMLSVAWGLTPPDKQHAILAAVGVPLESIPAVIGALFVVARLIDQPAIRK